MDRRSKSPPSVGASAPPLETEAIDNESVFERVRRELSMSSQESSSSSSMAPSPPKLIYPQLPSLESTPLSIPADTIVRTNY